MTTAFTFIHTPVNSIAGGSAKKNVFGRFFHALLEARQRKADRELAEILVRQGGTMAHSQTDPLHSGRRTYPFHEMRVLKSD